jgi:hypothetical protein
MITPKPKSVVELFEGHPERWIKGAYYGYRDEDGRVHIWQYKNANCWCLDGAIREIHGADLAEELIRKIDTVCFNDAPERTFEEVLAKCKELGI